MSIKLTPGAARLTVLGSGWSSSSVESGDGLTEDGKLWEDIAGDLGYDFGDDVDWDQIAGGSINWSDVVYEDFDGNIYTDLDGDGIYADPNTGNEAPEDVNRYKALAFVGTSGVQMGWLASQADMLADDWRIVE